jgi:hypothetical protein
LRDFDTHIVRHRHLARVAVVREPVVPVAVGDVVLDHMVDRDVVAAELASSPYAPAGARTASGGPGPRHQPRWRLPRPADDHLRLVWPRWQGAGAAVVKELAPEFPPQIRPLLRLFAGQVCARHAVIFVLFVG